MKVILVTGANRGIGYEICYQLAKIGHTVILTARELNKGKAAAEKIEGNVHVVQLDVANSESIEQAAKQVYEEIGKLDVLINNAGISIENKDATDADMKKVKKTMEINFFGPWRVTQAFLPLLRKSENGRIINVSSSMGALENLVGMHSAYRLSKTALNGLTIELSNELKGEISVNAIHPGWVRTDLGGPNANLSVEEGAESAVWLATAEQIPTGKFIHNRKEINW